MGVYYFAVVVLFALGIYWRACDGFDEFLLALILGILWPLVVPIYLVYNLVDSLRVLYVKLTP